MDPVDDQVHRRDPLDRVADENRKVLRFPHPRLLVRRRARDHDPVLASIEPLRAAACLDHEVPAARRDRRRDALRSRRRRRRE